MVLGPVGDAIGGRSHRNAPLVSIDAGFESDYVANVPLSKYASLRSDAIPNVDGQRS